MKKVLMFIGIALVLVFPGVVFADVTVQLSCDGVTLAGPDDAYSLMAGTTVTCEIQMDSENGISSAQMYLKKGNNITISDVAINQGDGGIWGLTGVDPKPGETDPFISAVSDALVVQGHFVFATFKVTAEEIDAAVDTKVYLSDVSIAEGPADNYLERAFAEINYPITISKDVTPKDTNNELEYIRLVTEDNVTRNYRFVDGTLHDTIDYSIIGNAEHITIEAKTLSNKATVSGDTGNLTLTDGFGKNTFTITVTSESGDNKVYTVNIYKRTDSDPTGHSEDTPSSEDSVDVVPSPVVDPTSDPEPASITNPSTSVAVPILLILILGAIVTVTMILKRKNKFKRI